MNLHFLPDNGFMNYFIEISEKHNKKGENIYIVVHPEYKNKITSVKKIKSKLVISAIYKSDLFNTLVGDISAYDKIFLHFLSDEACDFIVKNMSCSAKMYWLFWGADLYSPFSYFSNLIYDSDSVAYYNKHRSYTTSNNKLINALKFIKARFFSDSFAKNKMKIKSLAISRINFFCHYNTRDFEEMKAHFRTNAQFLPFFYFEYDYSKLSVFDSELSESILNKLKIGNRPIIQLGNSASLSNNHLSAIKQLSKINLHNATVMCPLSYGDLRYAKKVRTTGVKFLGVNFKPLNSFLSKEEYLSLLKSVDIALMNHLRTEAAGNIFMFLALQKRVVLNSGSNLYKFLIENGVIVDNFDILSNHNIEELLAPLPEQISKKNCTIIANIFSFDNAEKNISHLYASG